MGTLSALLCASGLTVREIGILAFIYPATWGVAQLWTGALSDRVGRKGLIAAGMALQGVALIGVALVRGFAPWLILGAVLGIGTAMVYPSLLAAVGDAANPAWRASALGVYRFWRDLGYAAGALLAGLLADTFGMPSTIAVIGVLTAFSGAYVKMRMPTSTR